MMIAVVVEICICAPLPSASFPLVCAILNKPVFPYPINPAESKVASQGLG